MVTAKVDERLHADAAAESTSLDVGRVDELVDEALRAAAEASSADRRTRNRLRTKQAILQAAWSLFLTVGYEETTVQDITDAADIGKGTFFSHFNKKSDVALYLCTHRRDVVLEMHASGAFGTGSATSRIERMMVTFAGLNSQPDPEARCMTEIVLRQFFSEPSLIGPNQPPIEAALEEILRAGVESGEYPANTDTESIARLIHAAFYSAKAAWLRPGPWQVPFDLTTQVRDDVHTILRGLRT